MAIYDDCPECQSEYADRLTHDDHEQTGNREQRAGIIMENDRTSPATVFNPYYTGRPRTPASASKYTPLDRQEIIRRIKSGGSRPASPEIERPASSTGKKKRSPTPLSSSGFLPEERPKTPERQEDNQSMGMEIERPGSALHRGDFREKEAGPSGFQAFVDGTREDTVPALATSPVAPWHPDFPSAVFRQSRPQRSRPSSPPGLPIPRPVRSRAASLASQSASFVYKPPTSPLAQSSRADTPEPGARDRSRSPDKSRRHTFSPGGLQHFRPDLNIPSSWRDKEHAQPPTLRAERTFPYQAHQPRRSTHAFSAILPAQMRSAASRRPSLSDSPLHHAPMVGSYEESILRGRMSTTPSKPLNFVAQIGVLGKGDCKPALKCPPHASVPFPAVFYSYSAGSSTTGDQPSPYVGLVDLENNLPPADTGSDKRRQRLHASLNNEGSRASSRTREESSASDAQAKRRRRQKQKRRSNSPKAPPGGSYRIPQQGQLQIIIKNPNKTAVKLFLIPYDLSDMEPGQKTFIRQRSYSAGPIIDMPLSSRKNLGTDRPEAALNATDDPNERPTLRYLVHLHICCPAKGRYFLYKSVRVVFANRVPDGKESLRNEIQMPEPRYSTYKPSRDSTAPTPSVTTPNDVSRHTSDIHATTPPADSNIFWQDKRRFLAHSLPSAEYDPSAQYGLPMGALPLHSINGLPTLESRPASRQLSDGMMDIDSDYPSQDTQSNRSNFSSPHSNKTGNEIYPFAGPRRLDDPFSFERDTSRERKAGGRNESLLSRRLKDLAFQNQEKGNGSEGNQDTS